MKNTMLATFVLAAVLSGPFMAWAQHGGHGGASTPMPSIPEVRTGKTTGKVVEVNDNSITVATNRKGSLKVTYLIDRRTKTKGTLAVGQEVVVKHREERGVLVATNIEVKKTKRSGGMTGATGMASSGDMSAGAVARNQETP